MSVLETEIEKDKESLPGKMMETIDNLQLYTKQVSMPISSEIWKALRQQVRAAQTDSQCVGLLKELKYLEDSLKKNYPALRKLVDEILDLGSVDFHFFLPKEKEEILELDRASGMRQLYSNLDRINTYYSRAKSLSSTRKAMRHDNHQYIASKTECSILTIDEMGKVHEMSPKSGADWLAANYTRWTLLEEAFKKRYIDVSQFTEYRNDPPMVAIHHLRSLIKAGDSTVYS